MEKTSISIRTIFFFVSFLISTETFSGSAHADCRASSAPGKMACGASDIYNNNYLNKIDNINLNRSLQKAAEETRLRNMQASVEALSRKTQETNSLLLQQRRMQEARVRKQAEINRINAQKVKDLQLKADKNINANSNQIASNTKALDQLKKVQKNATPAQKAKVGAVIQKTEEREATNLALARKAENDKALAKKKKQDNEFLERKSNYITKKLPNNIHDGQQGKHIIGHKNYDRNTDRSILTADANELLNGVHTKKYPIIRFAGDKPVVSFNKEIGKYGKNGPPTDYGIIHSNKNGAHIVPANPEQY